MLTKYEKYHELFIDPNKLPLPVDAVCMTGKL